MTTLSVFVCPSGAQFVATDASGNQYASCAAGQGAYQNVDVDEAFDPSTLDSSALAGAFGAGFTVMATGLVIAWAAKQLVRAIRQAL